MEKRGDFREGESRADDDMTKKGEVWENPFRVVSAEQEKTLSQLRGDNTGTRSEFLKLYSYNYRDELRKKAAEDLAKEIDERR
jgi:hypothetical protein